MKNDTTVECSKCGRLERVNFGFCLRNGWPKCHALTMRAVWTPTEEQIDEAVRAAVAGAKIYLKFEVA